MMDLKSMFDYSINSKANHNFYFSLTRDQKFHHSKWLYFRTLKVVSFLYPQYLVEVD